MEKWNILLFKFNNDFSFPVGIYGESQVAFSGITIFFLVGVGDSMVFDADIGLGDVVAFHRDDFLGIFLDTLGICIQDVDGHFQALVLFAWEGIDRIISFPFLKLEAFGLAALYASITRYGVKGAAASRIVKLDAVRLGGDGGVGDMDLKLCHGSIQQDVIIRIFSIYHVESAVIEEGIGHLVLVEFHFLRGTDCAVSASVMADGNHSVFSRIQIKPDIIVAIFCFQIQSLHLFLSIKNGDGESGAVIF